MIFIIINKGKTSIKLIFIVSRYLIKRAYARSKDLIISMPIKASLTNSYSNSIFLSDSQTHSLLMIIYC